MDHRAALLANIVGPFAHYCSCSGIHPDGAYVTTPLIGIGVAPLPAMTGVSRVLTHTVAFDAAEAEGANITQINLIAVSSFNGVQGLLLGYDLLRQPYQPHPLLLKPCVFTAAPLFAATRALYGTVAKKRFPISPGQMLPCASKTRFQEGPACVYGAMAIAIAEDRAVNADLFLEDQGMLTDESGGMEDTQQTAVLTCLLDAVGQISQNLDVAYAHVFVGLHSRWIAEGEVGCVLTAAPYIHLAQHAVPNGDPSCLGSLTLPEWEETTRPHFLNS